MIQNEKLDIRTITMGISLRDCCSEDSEKSCEKIYDKITRCAKNLVKTGEDIEREFGIPIINKRIAVTPVSIIAESSKNTDFIRFAKTLDRAAAETGVNFIGGYSALVHKGFTDGDRLFIESIPYALSETERVCCSVNVATTRTGINMDAVKQMGAIIKETAQRTADKGGIGCAKLVVFANAVEDNPFMAELFTALANPNA